MLRLALVLPRLTHVLPCVARIAVGTLLRLGGAGVVTNSGVTMRLSFVMVRLAHAHAGVTALLMRVRFCLTRRGRVGRLHQKALCHRRGSDETQCQDPVDCTQDAPPVSVER